MITNSQKSEFKYDCGTTSPFTTLFWTSVVGADGND